MFIRAIAPGAIRFKATDFPISGQFGQLPELSQTGRANATMRFLGIRASNKIRPISYSRCMKLSTRLAGHFSNNVRKRGEESCGFGSPIGGLINRVLLAVVKLAKFPLAHDSVGCAGSQPTDNTHRTL